MVGNLGRASLYKFSGVTPTGIYFCRLLYLPPADVVN